MIWKVNLWKDKVQTRLEDSINIPRICCEQQGLCWFSKESSLEAGLGFWTSSQRPRGTSVRSCDMRRVARDGDVSACSTLPPLTHLVCLTRLQFLLHTQG